ncbi:MAG: hypothetical protein WA058_03920 [Minisyncoccia bacterium]
MGEHEKKKILGQYNTTSSKWLLPQIIDFIEAADPSIVVDPFAGDGHLLDAVKSVFKVRTSGLDIDAKKGWIKNDSLIGVPRYSKGLILTNPPYLSNYSAKRKGLYSNVSKYFESNLKHDDLYRIALDACLEKNNYVIAIIPETYINSSYTKERAQIITIIEDSLFEDTETPVCIVCFGPRKSQKGAKIYIGERFVGFFDNLLQKKISPTNVFPIRFNDSKGKIGLRAIDMPNPSKRISFLTREELGYDMDKIKVSSRLITFISIPTAFRDKTSSVIERANEILSVYRKETHDVLLSPFKGNNKEDLRRRRLDYSTARGILETALALEV